MTSAGQVRRKFHVIGKPKDRARADSADLPGKEFKTDTDPSSVFVINL